MLILLNDRKTTIKTTIGQHDNTRKLQNQIEHSLTPKPKHANT